MLRYSSEEGRFVCNTVLSMAISAASIKIFRSSALNGRLVICPILAMACRMSGILSRLLRKKSGMFCFLNTCSIDGKE